MIFQRRIILQIQLFAAALDPIEWWLGDKKVSAVHKLPHVAKEKCKQKCANVRPINVSIGHDDDLVVA